MMLASLLIAMAAPAENGCVVAADDALPPAVAADDIGVLRNRCGYRVVAYMCVVGPPAQGTDRFFDCARGQVGSYDLRPNGSAPAIFRGARQVHWFACRFPDYLPRQVQYRAGKGLTGRCE